jgi:hypothetical protein
MPVTRLDDVRAAKELDLRYSFIQETAEEAPA